MSRVCVCVTETCFENTKDSPESGQNYNLRHVMFSSSQFRHAVQKWTLLVVDLKKQATVAIGVASHNFRWHLIHLYIFFRPHPTVIKSTYFVTHIVSVFQHFEIVSRCRGCVISILKHHTRCGEPGKIDMLDVPMYLTSKCTWNVRVDNCSKLQFPRDNIWSSWCAFSYACV